MDDAMEMCITYEQFKKIMRKKGYVIDDRYTLKYPTIRSFHDKKAVRLYRLGEKYLPRNIAEKVLYNPYYYQQRYLDFVKPKTRYKKYKVYKYKGSFENISKKSSIELLFLALFYFMGLIQVPQALKII